MKIVITGNMGYVGPIVTQHLRNRFPDATLVGIDSGMFGHCLAGAETFPEGLLDVQYYADVRDVDDSLLDGADALVLLAAISNDPMGKAFEDVTAEINRDACIRMARAACDKGVGHVVFASSCSVYGFAEGGARKESDDLDPLTAYARSKVDTEFALKDFDAGDTVITCLRFPTACGMSPRIRLDLVLNDFVAAAVATGRIQILSDGTPWRPLIDIRDMARAIEWAILRSADQGGSFLAINSGRDESNYQVKALAEAVREVMPDVDIDINPDAQPDKRSYQVDFGLYRQLAPDHLPAISLQTSITQVRDGLQRIGFDDPDFRQSDYMRLRVLSGLRDSGRLNEHLRWTKENEVFETKLKGAYIIDVEPRGDDRGFFARAWCRREFEEAGLETRVAQANMSFSRDKGTLRGMHWQVPPHAETKLVRCIRGAIYDVIVDLRQDSPTFLQWVGVELTADNRRIIMVPEGFAHGMQTLVDDTEVYYQVSEYYAPDAERGARHNDPAFDIQWPLPVTTMSEKDANWPDFAPEEAAIPIAATGG